MESFTSYWSDTLALRNTDRSQTAVKLIEAYLARHGKKFDEEAVARVDKEMGRYQDMAILNPRHDIASAIQILAQRGLKLGLSSQSRDPRSGGTMARKHVLAALGAALVVSVAAFTSSAASKSARLAGDDPNNASLTYWYWGEDDAPGANGWLKQQVARYEKAHPKVKITVVSEILIPDR